jgi:hypothetical protein
MSSFSCPNVSSSDNYCLKLKIDCVPGRNGCVLGKRFQFAVPVEKRLADNKLKKNAGKNISKKSNF